VEYRGPANCENMASPPTRNFSWLQSLEISRNAIGIG
jgi:hypothetical protein